MPGVYQVPNKQGDSLGQVAGAVSAGRTIYGGYNDIKGAMNAPDAGAGTSPESINAAFAPPQPPPPGNMVMQSSQNPGMGAINRRVAGSTGYGG